MTTLIRGGTVVTAADVTRCDIGVKDGKIAAVGTDVASGHIGLPVPGVEVKLVPPPADDVAGKTVPAIYFGARKINNNYDVVDEIKKTSGATATVFVKDGEEFIRVSTNVLTPEGKRGVGTQLARNPVHLLAPALAELAKVGFDPVFGARPLKRAIQQRIENPLSKSLLEGRFPPKTRIAVSVDPVRNPGVFAFEGQALDA